jgi:Tol biopolymer transport system component
MLRVSAIILRAIAILSLATLFLAGCSTGNDSKRTQPPNSFDESPGLICYVVSESGALKIKSLDPTTGIVGLIVSLGGDRAGGLSWSPDRTQIAFAANSTSAMEIWLVGSNGSNLRQITGLSKTPSNTDCLNPTWVNDQYLIYTEAITDKGGGQLYQINIDSAQSQPLAIYPGAPYCYSQPSLSLDGALMACNIAVPIETTQSSILIVNYPNFGNKHVISIPGQKAAHPNCSAIGLWAYDEISTGIYTVLSSGAQLTNISGLTHTGDYNPVFSENGGQVAFLSSESGNINIWIMNVNGADRQMITDEPSGNTIMFLDW